MAGGIRFPRQNNLEWLRLLFAVQVVATHSAAHLGMAEPRWLSAFPGVPAFFFVSGFLIYASYRHSGGSDYVRNRFLRLIPALVLVTLGGMGVALIAHGWRDLFAHPGLYPSWFLAQITLGQAYNPGHFRDIGVGVINGSLWTITTEILFYFMVPVIVWMERYVRHTVLLLTALSFLIYATAEQALAGIELAGKPLFEYLYITPILWGWMFGLGILAFQHWDRLAPWIRYMPLLLIPMLAMLALDDKGLLFNGHGQRMGLFYFLGYSGMILWLAFGLRPVPLPFDISYGTYIWHMPVINLMLVLKFTSVPLAFALTIAIAFASWFLIERPFLRLKRRTLHPPDPNHIVIAAAQQE